MTTLDSPVDNPPRPGGTPLRTGMARSPGLTYDDLLDMDTHAVPEVLRKRNWHFLDDADIPVSRYTSREFHDLEVEKVWTKVWQMACRADDIAEVGDSLVYDIAGLSILLVRQDDTSIKAFFNVCLHRGRQLRDGDGKCMEDRIAALFPIHALQQDQEIVAADVADKVQLGITMLFKYLASHLDDIIPFAESIDVVEGFK